jgi:hypothetical protein
MTNISNYPLLKDETLNLEEILLYINTFSQHVIEIDTLFLNDDLLISKHKYNDGLIIEMYWSIPNNKNIINFNKIMINDLLSLSPIIIQSKFFNIEQYSESNNISQDIIKKYEECVITKRKKNIPSEIDYNIEEFYCSSNLNLSDDFFAELDIMVNNFNLFEKYLSENTKQ